MAAGGGDVCTLRFRKGQETPFLPSSRASSPSRWILELGWFEQHLEPRLLTWSADGKVGRGAARRERTPMGLRTSIAMLAALSVLGCTDLTGADTQVPNAGESIDLPEPQLEGDVPVERALAARRSVREYSDVPLQLTHLAQLAWAAQGVTDTAGYRTSPSAGALYPLELYVVAGKVLGLEAGVYRYVPAGHRLVRHAGGDARGAVARAALLQRWIADAPAILVLVGFTERSAAKYGDRAPRYVHMEVGHAAQNVYLQAGALGLGTCVVGAFHDGQLKRVLALPQAAQPLALLPVGTPR